MNNSIWLEIVVAIGLQKAMQFKNETKIQVETLILKLKRKMDILSIRTFLVSFLTLRQKLFL